MIENKEQKNFISTEDLTALERVKLIKSSQFLCFSLNFFLLIELIVSFSAYFFFIKDTFIFYLISLNLCEILSTILLIFWFRRIGKHCLKSLEILKLKIKFFRKASQILFIIVLICALVKIILILWLIYHQTDFLYQIKAQLDPLAFNSIENDLIMAYNIYIIIQISIFLIKALHQCFISYGLTNNSFSVASFRIIFITIIIICLFFCFMNLYFSKMANNYLLSYQNSDSLINTTLLQTIFAGTVVLIISNLAGIVVNLVRWKSIYLIFSALKLIFSLTFLSLSSMVLRNSHNLLQMYLESCPTLLKLFSQDYLINIDCPYKYKTQLNNSTLTYDLQCPSSEMGIVWDTSPHANHESNSYTLSCLNYDCCGLLASALVKEFVILGLVSFLISILGFTLSSISFYLSMKSNVEANYYSKTIDFFRPMVDVPRKTFFKKHLKELISFMAFLLFCVAFILVSYYGNSALKLQNFYYPDINFSFSTESKNVTSLMTTGLSISKKQDLYTLLSSTASNNFCNNFTDAMSEDQLNDMVQGDNESSVLRIALLGVNIQFAITFNFGSAGIKLFNLNLESYQSAFFPNSSKNCDFILFEGTQPDLLFFITNSVKICSFPYADSQLQFVKYIKNATNVKLNSTRYLALQNHRYHEKIITHKTSNQFPTISTKAGSVFDSYTWGHIKGTVFDSDTKEPLSEVKLSLIPWKKTECEYQNTKEVSRVGYTDIQGKIKFFNMIKKTYTIVFTKAGYKTNCLVIDFKANSSENSFVAILVKEFYDSDYMITLEWKTSFNYSQNVSNTTDLQLQATYTQSQKTCFSSIFEADCKEMFSNSTEFFNGEFAFQKIIMKTTLSTNYLFYLQKLPFVNNDNGIEEFGPSVKMYSSSVNSPITLFDYPYYNDTQMVRNPVWLVFCFDGNKGEIIPLGKIWYDNSTNNGDVSLPTAAFCS